MNVDLRGFSTSIFGGFSDKYSKYFAVVKESLPKADIRMAFRTYLSMVFFFTVLVYFSSLFVVIIALGIVEISLLLMIAIGLFIPMMVSMIAFFTILFYPYQKANSRKKNIESNLPFVLTHMGAVSASGVPPFIVFKLISKFGEYGEISKEMGKIVRNAETFGIDPMSAVKDIAMKSPSEEFKQILLGFVTSTESGGDVKEFLKNAGEQALFQWRMKRERFLQKLSAYAEFYTGLLIAAPLFIIALFSVMNMIQPTISGFSLLSLMKLSIYLVVPILNASFLGFLKGVEVEI